MYPERLIRPLPKRRLRSRLSEEEAKTIEFPPAPPTVSPLFTLPYVDKPQGPAHRAPRGDVDEHRCQCGADHGIDHVAELLDGAQERGLMAAADGVSEQAGQYHHAWEHAPGPYGKPPPPGSTASSADGYDSFENTNNKKKRKIPLSGGNHHHSSLSAELVNMSISNSAADTQQPNDTRDDGGQYYGQGSAPAHASSGTGISGAGRGRYGRPRHSLDRRPLSASTNGLSPLSSTGNAKGKIQSSSENCTIV